MDEERYPGERRGLRLFLEELMPALEAGGATYALLRHAIRRALLTGALQHFRHARRLFNHLPRGERQALSATMLGPRGRKTPRREEMLEQLSRCEPIQAICFETPSEAQGLRPIKVELRHELAPPVPLRVTIEPGTLPSVAADSLRRIATMIETDRRLLSPRFWDQDPASDEQRDAR
jgi:hypothetical protein